jgi:hypothetical protein
VTERAWLIDRPSFLTAALRQPAWRRPGDAALHPLLPDRPA